MPRVVIQPSYGNPNAWRHWADTLEQEVEYESTGYADALSGTERAALDRLHPAGRARFWGATANHDSRMASLVKGDVVLFTGQSSSGL